MEKEKTFMQELREIGDTPTYKQFNDKYLELFRKYYPHSSYPKKELISMFYDDYIGNLPVPSY